MNQVYNPYMPSFEYVPDGEPHVFDNRIFVYGSHDRFNGAQFCLNDYVCYSADINDLTKWKYEGIIYSKLQDPRNKNIPENAEQIFKNYRVPVKDESCINPNGLHAMWAPDVVKGPDGRYYLYYCLDVLPEVAVAVSNSPAGKYEFYGFVQHSDGTPLGTGSFDLVQFDPGVFTDDDGTIYLYSGNAPMHKGDIAGNHASQVMTLDNDMLTLKTEPQRLICDVNSGEGTSFAGHEFFEASSIRKINGKYYFVYSSVVSHELCYAVSERPDRDYEFGGTIVDIADISLNGRTADEALNCLGNTHGGIECVDGQWYVFYHRQTNQTNYSRQACAEKIYFDKEGHIKQAEVTSCGLNKGPLEASGKYPAYIACQLNRNGSSVLSMPANMKEEYPYFTQDIKDTEPNDEMISRDKAFPIMYIANIKDNAAAGYKYFNMHGNGKISLKVRGNAHGTIIAAADNEMNSIGQEELAVNSSEWENIVINVKADEGIHALYFIYKGTGSFDLVQFEFIDEQ